MGQRLEEDLLGESMWLDGSRNDLAADQRWTSAEYQPFGRPRPETVSAGRAQRCRRRPGVKIMGDKGA